ncbi:MAG: MCP four helix bundle domain-containing protein, partial [Burkholderiales bacterium]|nr:MCP four helix bundle domain-containing protein [Burkholderiales bacterium]
MNLSSFSIRQRLNIGFAIVLLLLVVLSTFAVMRMDSLRSSYREALGDSEALANVLRFEGGVRANGRRAFELFLVNKEDLGALLERIEANNKNVTEAFAKVEAEANTPDEKSYVEKLKLDRATFLTSLKKVQAQLVAGNRDEATNTARKELSPALDQLNARLKEMVDLQAKHAQMAMTESEATYKSTVNTVISFAIVITLICIAFAFLVTRSITRPLSDAVKVAECVGTGNFAVVVDTSGSDEIGKLMAAMQTMVKSIQTFRAEQRS